VVCLPRRAVTPGAALQVMHYIRSAGQGLRTASFYNANYIYFILNVKNSFARLVLLFFRGTLRKGHFGLWRRRRRLVRRRRRGREQRRDAGRRGNEPLLAGASGAALACSSPLVVYFSSPKNTAAKYARALSHSCGAFFSSIFVALLCFSPRWPSR
jgi:hypothetical protein